MNIFKTALEGVLVLEPPVFADSRGYFFESFNQEAFAKATGLHVQFVQDNQSQSKYGVIRGLHYQKPPHAQSRLVRALAGTLLDVVVDVRKNSPTFGQHISVVLSAENKRQIWVPKGFAHGIAVLSESATLAYKCDVLYAAHANYGILFNDPALGIDWQIPSGNIIVSEKDAQLPLLQNMPHYF